MFFGKNYNELDTLLKQAKKALNKSEEKDKEDKVSDTEDLDLGLDLSVEEPKESKSVQSDITEDETKTESQDSLGGQIVEAIKNSEFGKAVSLIIKAIKPDTKSPPNEQLLPAVLNSICPEYVAPTATSSVVAATGSTLVKKAAEIGTVSLEQVQALIPAIKQEIAKETAKLQAKTETKAENTAPQEAMNDAVAPKTQPSDMNQLSNDNASTDPTKDTLPQHEPDTINLDEKIDIDDSDAEEPASDIPVKTSLDTKVNKIAELLKAYQDYKPEKSKEDVILEIAASTDDALEFLKKSAAALDEKSSSPEYAGKKAFNDKTTTKEGGATPKFPGQKVFMENTQPVVTVYDIKEQPEYDVMKPAQQQNVTSINSGDGTIAFLQPIPLSEPVDITKAFNYNGIVTGERAQKKKDTGEQLAGAGHKTDNYYAKIDKLSGKDPEKIAGKWPASKSVEASAKSGLAKKADPDEGTEGYVIPGRLPQDVKKFWDKIFRVHGLGDSAYRLNDYAKAASYGKELLAYIPLCREAIEEYKAEIDPVFYEKSLRQLETTEGKANEWIDAASNATIQQTSSLGFTFLQKKADAPIPTEDNLGKGATIQSDATLAPADEKDPFEPGNKVTRDQIKAFQDQELKTKSQVAAAANTQIQRTAANENPSGDLKQDGKPGIPADLGTNTPATTGKEEKNSPLQRELDSLLEQIKMEAPAEYNKFKAEANNPNLLKQDIIDHLKQKIHILDADKFKACDFDKIAEKHFGIKPVQPKESATEKGKDKKDKKDKKEDKKSEDKADAAGDDIPDFSELLNSL